MNQEERGTRSRRSSLRSPLRWTTLLALLTVAGLILAACGGGSDSSSSSSGGGGETGESQSSSSSGSGETINVLTWETYDEPEWLEEFEDKTGVKVNATNVGSPAEMFSKVKANP